MTASMPNNFIVVILLNLLYLSNWILMKLNQFEISMVVTAQIFSDNQAAGTAGAMRVDLGRPIRVPI